MTRFRVALLTFFVCLSAVLGGVGYFLKETVGFSPHLEMDGLENSTAFTVPPEIQFVYNPVNAEERTLKTLAAVMNDERNKGLLCAGMAHIYRDALLAQGIPARKVVLKREKMSTHDSHVTVEAWINGKWRKIGRAHV